MNAPTTKVENNIQLGLEANWLPGYVIVASEQDAFEEKFVGYGDDGTALYEVVEKSYRISFHKGAMPAHEIREYKTLQELANAMRELQDIRKWRIVQND